MSIKTEYPYNEDNFIEVDGELKELTVTITLEEYRNLIENRCYSDKAIEELQEEVESLRSQRDSYLKIIYAKSPEIAAKIFEFTSLVSDIFSGDDTDCDDDTEESEEKENERT